MTNAPLGVVLRHIRTMAEAESFATQTDGQLLGRFTARRDESAFAALLRRHGPMVLGVCRRVLRAEADVEDAFQATFLVLVRKAAAIRPRALVGNWLFGVARKTALKARAMNQRRRTKEQEAAAQRQPAAPLKAELDLAAVLDEELHVLPTKYRAAIVLCDLEGKSLKEAAGQLGCPPKTVSTWLARGRSRLAQRLARRGLAPAAGAIAALLGQNAVSAGVPTPLLVSTVQTARLLAEGQALSGVVGAKVAALTEGVLKTMLLTKLKVITTLGLGFCVLAGAAAQLTYRLAAAAPPAATRAKEFTYLDLQPKATQKLTENFGGVPGNSFKELPQGEQTLLSVKFKIGESAIHLAGTELLGFPEKVNGIQVKKPFRKLYILHSTGFSTSDGILIGEYKVHFEDGSAETIPIVYGEDVRSHWSIGDSKEVTRGKVAWTGENDAVKRRNKKLLLYLTTWENPKPDKNVVSIDYLSKMTRCAPVCFGMTLEEK
jgi:RNA polymerase sigma factor (sigma-70 family)